MDYGAIDLHKKESQIRIVQEDGTILDHRVATTRERFTEIFWGRRRMRILVEASTESEWVAQHLEELGHEVIWRIRITPLCMVIVRVGSRLTDAMSRHSPRRVGGRSIGRPIDGPPNSGQDNRI